MQQTNQTMCDSSPTVTSHWITEVKNNLIANNCAHQNVWYPHCLTQFKAFVMDGLKAFCFRLSLSSDPPSNKRGVCRINNFDKLHHMPIWPRRMSQWTQQPAQALVCRLFSTEEQCETNYRRTYFLNYSKIVIVISHQNYCTHTVNRTNWSIKRCNVRLEVVFLSPIKLSATVVTPCGLSPTSTAQMMWNTQVSTTYWRVWMLRTHDTQRLDLLNVQSIFWKGEWILFENKPPAKIPTPLGFFSNTLANREFLSVEFV